MKHKINRQAECIHLSLDQGFYNTEPQGFSAGKAVELSLKQIHSIHNGLQQGKWSRLPIEATAEDSAKKEIGNLFGSLEIDLKALIISLSVIKLFNSFD